MSPLMFLSFATASAAEPWEDGLTERVPVGAYAALSGAAIVSDDAVGFTDLRAGAGLTTGGPAGVALSVRAGSVTSSGPEGPITLVRTVGADLWVTLEGDRSLHGVSLGYHQPPAPDAASGYFWLHPLETSPRLIARYDGFFDGDVVDGSLEVRLGVGATLPELSTTGVLLYGVSERVALSAGAQIALAPLGTAMAGVHYRPADHVEIGVTAGVPFPLFDQEWEPAIQPMLELKVHR